MHPDGLLKRGFFICFDICFDRIMSTRITQAYQDAGAHALADLT